MSMKNKRGKLAALLAAVLMVFTGCVRSGVGVTTLENDTGTVEISVGINEKYYESMMAQEGAEDIFDGKETAKLIQIRRCGSQYLSHRRQLPSVPCHHASRNER